jgi:cation:H+ antiporter
LAGRLAIDKSLIDVDLPLLALSTIVFLAAAYDGLITIPESIVLLATFAIYLLYIIHSGPTDVKEVLSTPSIGKTDKDNDGLLEEFEIADKRGHISFKDFGLLFLGIALLVFGAKYLIDSVIRISEIFNLLPGLITLVAVALGTSTPELLVSVKAAKHGHADVALGNIFGSNVFNILVVVGLPGLFGNLPIDTPTLTLAIPALIITTSLFVISGISRRIHIWEGGMYIILYLFFVGKLFGFL